MLVDEGGALRISLALDHEAGLTHRCELGSMIIDPVDSTILAVPDVSEKGYLDVGNTSLISRLIRRLF